MIIRPPNAAGYLYALDADDLVTDIAQNLLALPKGVEFPYALVVPHAEMKVCGRASAAAFRHLSKYSPYINRVVIIGAASNQVVGAALPVCDEYTTPLGRVKVTERYVHSLGLLPFVHRSDREHNKSNNIEAQLPYLQTCLSEFEILPILIGQMSEIDLSLLFTSLPFNNKTLTILSVDVDKESQRCLDSNEQRIFECYLDYIKLEERKLKQAEMGDLNIQVKSDSQSPYQSYIIH
ncbi:AmmeMemoRadiSam system protein B [Psychrosphaera sp.]|nr:AmmeMemoRadiSam system protein B [Psychrosphaera sp.]